MTSQPHPVTPDVTLTGLLENLPCELRTLIDTVDDLCDSWRSADITTRQQLWSLVDDAARALTSPTSPDLAKVLADVVDERARQDDHWGVQEIHDFERISILTEEVGEAAKAANKANFVRSPTRGNVTQLRAELIQVAAVAVGHVQAIDGRTRPLSDPDQGAHA